MMKYYLFGMGLLMAAFSFRASAQCIPDQDFTGNGVRVPEGSTFDDELGTWFFPNALTLAYYSEAFQFRLPKDTVIENIPLEIEYATIDSVKGLPKGLFFECVPNNCEFAAEQVGCTVIRGTVDSAAVGTTRLIVYSRVYAKVGGAIPIVDTSFFEIGRLRVEPNPDPLGLEDELQAIAGLQVSPNPAADRAKVTFEALNGGEGALRLLSVSGAVSMRQKLKARPGRNELDLSLAGLPKGLYRLMIQLPDGVASQSLIKH